MRLRLTPFLPALVLVAAGLTVLPGEARAATLTFAPSADATVNSSQPTKNSGRTSTLVARQSATGSSRSYLAFTISGLTGPVTSARLRLNATDPSPDGGTLYPVSATWSETSITWNNAPAFGTQALGSVGAVAAKGSRDVVIDAATIPASGTFSFAFTSQSTDQVAYNSRESTKGPQLIVDVASPVPSPTPSSTPAPTPSPTPTPFPTPSPTAAPTPSPTPSPSPSPVPTPSPTPSPDPPASATVDPAASPSPDPAATPSPDPTAAAPPDPTVAPTPTDTPLPTPGPLPTPDPTATPQPTPTPDPSPSPTATPPPPTPDPAPPPPPPVSPDVRLSRSLLISNADLMALPVSGPAWERLATDATAIWPAMDLSNQDLKHPRYVVAGALYAARTGDPVVRDKVIAALAALPTAPWSVNELAFARQLSGYVIAADLIGYRDPAFIAWLDTARTRFIEGHSRWTSLYFTAGNTSGNWGTWSLASLTAADLYLGDSAGIARDWAIYSGYGVPFATGWASGPFIKTNAWDQAWSSVLSDGTTKVPISIDVNGTLVEDASRSAGSKLDDTGAMYVYESVRAVTTTALLFRQAGYDVAGVTNGQLRRLVDWLRATPYAASSIDGTLWGYLRYSLSGWARFGLNHLLGTTYPTNDATNYDRHLGYTDWLWPG